MDALQFLGCHSGADASGMATITIPLPQFMSLQQQLAQQQQQLARQAQQQVATSSAPISFVLQQAPAQQQRAPQVAPQSQALPLLYPGGLARQLIAASLGATNAGVTVQAPVSQPQPAAPVRASDLLTLSELLGIAPASPATGHAPHAALAQQLLARHPQQLKLVSAAHSQQHSHAALVEAQATSGTTASAPPSPSTCGGPHSTADHLPTQVLQHHQYQQQPHHQQQVQQQAAVHQHAVVQEQAQPQHQPQQPAAVARRAVAQQAPKAVDSSGANNAVSNRSSPVPRSKAAAAREAATTSEPSSSADKVLVAKALTRSDAHTRRLILPRMSVEANLPMVIGTPSYTFDVLDAHGNVWQFVIRSWPNGANPKPVYVLEHISDYVKAYGIGAGDVLGLCLNQDGQLMVEVNTDAVITAARRTANTKSKPRRAPNVKIVQYVRSEAEKLITPELARTMSEQMAVLDAMEVLTSFQGTGGKRPAPDAKPSARPVRPKSRPRYEDDEDYAQEDERNDDEEDTGMGDDDDDDYARSVLGQPNGRRPAEDGADNGGDHAASREAAVLPAAPVAVNGVC